MKTFITLICWCRRQLFWDHGRLICPSVSLQWFMKGGIKNCSNNCIFLQIDFMSIEKITILLQYHKNPKSPEKVAAKYLSLNLNTGFTWNNEFIRVDPDQTAPLVWSGSTLFAKTCLSEKLRIIKVTFKSHQSKMFCTAMILLLRGFIVTCMSSISPTSRWGGELRLYLQCQPKGWENAGLTLKPLIQ